MNLESQKLEIIRWIEKIENADVISQLQQVKMAFSGDWWEAASESEKENIQEGLADIAAGNVVANETVMQSVKEKFGV